VTLLVEPPLALYVHLPWCVRKCPYCDFNSHAVPAQGFPERRYLAALLGELEFEAARHPGRPLISIFFGGGTPSLFSADSIGRLLERAVERLGAAPDLEVTLEANPGTVERGRFAAYRDAGVTRVSLGAQSFDPRQLEALGRIHSSGEILAAVDELRAAGLDNFNLDLMYALPLQSVEGALADLEQAIALGPAHLSHYQLTLEPGTVFERRPPPLPDEETAYAMQLACQARLDAAGYRQYEVSAYASRGRECRHNLNYWRFGDYLGIGAGAHGKLTDVGTGELVRTARLRQPARYLVAADGQARLESTQCVAPAERVFEYFLNVLRLREGFDVAGFTSGTGLPWSAAASTVELAEARGLLYRCPGDRWAPTERGSQFLNDLQALFLPEMDPMVADTGVRDLASRRRMG
jgi:oxygen-independent coproporphyrinogen-3 oxidase